MSFSKPVVFTRHGQDRMADPGGGAVSDHPV
jgi:hypothetical protein